MVTSGIKPSEAIAFLREVKSRLLQRCSQLEALADSLPLGFSQENALTLLRSTDADLRRHIDLQESVIFPKLRASEEGGPEIKRVLRQLEYEHAYDSALIVEMIETAMTPALSTTCQSAERFGCLLRHFFEAYRRHDIWETEFLDPLLKRFQ